MATNQTQTAIATQPPAARSGVPEDMPDSARRKRQRPLTWEALNGMIQTATSDEALGKAVKQFVEARPKPSAPVVEQHVIDAIAPFVVDGYLRKASDRVIEGKLTKCARRGTIASWAEAKAEVSGMTFDHELILQVILALGESLGKGMATMVHFDDSVLNRYAPRQRRTS